MAISSHNMSPTKSEPTGARPTRSAASLCGSVAAFGSLTFATLTGPAVVSALASLPGPAYGHHGNHPSSTRVEPLQDPDFSLLAKGNGPVYSLCATNNALWIGTNASEVVGANTAHGAGVFAFTGTDSKWVPVDQLLDPQNGPGIVTTINVYGETGPDIIAGGRFSISPGTEYSLARFNKLTGSWEGLEGPPANTVLESVAIGNNGAIYVGGVTKEELGVYKVVLGKFVGDQYHNFWPSNWQVGGTKSLGTVPGRLISGRAEDQTQYLVGSGGYARPTPHGLISGEFYARIDGSELELDLHPMGSKYHGLGNVWIEYNDSLLVLGQNFFERVSGDTLARVGAALRWNPLKQDFEPTVNEGFSPEGDITCATKILLSDGKEILLVGGDFTIDTASCKIASFDGEKWRPIETLGILDQEIPTSLALYNRRLVFACATGNIFEAEIFAPSSTPNHSSLPTPNPTQGLTFVSAASGSSGKVFDVNGRFVSEMSSVNGPSGQVVLSWDGYDGHGQPAAAGVYFIAVSDGAKRPPHKVILLR